MRLRLERWKVTRALALVFAPTLLAADDPPSRNAIEFRVNPRSCVTLHEDQPCFQRLAFSWTLPSNGIFCLYRESDSEPIVCWRNDALREHSLHFVGTEAESFFLRRREGGKTLAETRVVVEWVYRGGRRGASGWRLF